MPALYIPTINKTVKKGKCLVTGRIKEIVEGIDVVQFWVGFGRSHGAWDFDWNYGITDGEGKRESFESKFRKCDLCEETDAEKHSFC